MNNLTLFLLGLVLINIPSCLSQSEDKQCFSLSLKPSYPCCEGNKVVYTDKDGDWGIENNKWCGIGNGPEESNESCFSVALGYSCCKKCKVVLSDEDGDWGVENKKWCGIKDSCSSPGEITEDDKEKKESSLGDPDFDLAFLKLENDKKNVIYSPLSIRYALNMLQEGAKGSTYDEINKLIGNKELPKYENNKNITLANGLFIRDVYYEFIRPKYRNTLQDNYNAEVIVDSFKSADRANKWVEDKTFGIIKDILTDDAVTPEDVGAIILNALAIDMSWEVSFNRNSTTGYNFNVDDDKTMKATMMQLFKIKNENIKYYINDDITVLNMNLKEINGIQFEFMAIMPKGKLISYIENVSKEAIDEIDKNLKSTSSSMDGANIKIPRFEFDYNLKLKDDLKNLGVDKAFDKDYADFSAMADIVAMQSNVYVSDAVHKANIEFTEKGTKAAAATAIVMGGFAMGMRWEQPIDIIIDKPFMFIIRDRESKDVWFTGTVYEPNEWEKDKESYKN